MAIINLPRRPHSHSGNKISHYGSEAGDADQIYDDPDNHHNNTPGSTEIQKTLSRLISHKSDIEPGPPPDGGFRAWSQVLVTFIVVLNTWGYINSFGVFQTYYVTALSHSLSDVSWIGSVQIFLLFFIGSFSGRATDAGYFRAALLSGTVLMLLGVFMSSLTTQYWQLFLAQGICVGRR